MTTTTRIAQIESHGVNRAKFAFASFCFGSGWKGHRTEATARKSAASRARYCVKNFGGGSPENLVVTTTTGESI